ncbi:Gfo/Idh/MocA family protein [Cohaesibacter gelatinilyticus]|uniref:Predicted dehydrogenase n=1 Tax=Cohaesibacter gelatinilyticus TaxID=372072 RepID=A0A285PEH0_9HYPH|nr:Gfo/Idh/MocA family oxidoreductase [Cohaesibacter gelatinilyticus]SNZ20132.1 Predicted dehydrogenase [Cohaesibacter gelatinilyticus]
MRVLIVGQGSIGKRHLAVARDLLPDAEIRILRHQPTDDVPDLADGCLSAMADAVAYAPDLSVIAWPATHHIAVAQCLAEAGSHLLMEKPLSSNLEGTTKLMATCRAQDRVCMVGYNLRYVDSLQTYRQMISNGQVGRILSVRSEIGQYLPDWRPDSDYRTGVSARQELGGGALLELSHEIDYLRWIFGDVNWVQAVMCRHSDLEINVEDTVYLMLGLEPTSVAAQPVANVALDFVRRDPVRTCTAIGSEGTLRWTASEGLVEFYDPEKSVWQVVFRGGTVRDSYYAEWHNLLKCIEGTATPLVSVEDGIRVLDIISAARAAADTGTRVNVQNTLEDKAGA